MSAKNSPLVAVYTPVYNGARTLRAALDCVQAQTYSNLVHVVLDNASTDATAALIAEASINPRHPVLAVRNPATLPQFDNWNACAALTPEDAAFAYLLCADDWIAPTTIARMVEIAIRDPRITIVGCDLIDPAGGVRPAGWPKDISIFDGRRAIALWRTNQTALIPVHALMRRDILKLRTPFYDASLPSGADADAVCFALLHGSFGYVHEALAIEGENPDGATSRAVRPTQSHYIDCMRILRRYGPECFDAGAFAATFQRFRRHHLQRMLAWRLQGRGEAVALHEQAWRAESLPATWPAYADALIAWGLAKARGREVWTGWPVDLR